MVVQPKSRLKQSLRSSFFAFNSQKTGLSPYYTVPETYAFYTFHVSSVRLLLQQRKSKNARIELEEGE